MVDYSTMSDEDLERMAGGAPSAAPAKVDISGMSDEELERLANPAPPDKTTGAPAPWRFAVGIPKSNEDKLATLQNLLHGKGWDASKARMEGEDLYYHDPDIKKDVLVNPSGIDWGDLAGAAPELANAVTAGVTGIAAKRLPLVKNAAVASAAGRAVEEMVSQAGKKFFPEIVDSRSWEKQGLDAALDTAIGTAFGAGAGKLMGAIGNLPTRAKAYLHNALTSGDTATIAAAFKRLGIEAPPPNAISKSRLMAGIEQPVKDSIVGQPLHDSYQAAREGIESAVGKTADAFDPARAGISMDTTGKAVREGATKAAGNFSDQAAVNYGAFRSKVPLDTPTDVTNFYEALLGAGGNKFRVLEKTGDQLAVNPALKTALENIQQDLGAAFKGNTGYNPRTLEEMLAGAPVPFKEVSELRSAIGRKLADVSGMLQADIPRAELKNVYAALSKDLEASIGKHDPSALAAFKKANTEYARGFKEIEDVLQPLIDKKFDYQAFRDVMQGAKFSGEQLERLRKVMPDKTWDTLAGFELRNLGLGKDGTFNVAQFATGWKNLSPEARQAMWGGTRYGHLTRQLDDIALASDNLARAQGNINASKSGNTLYTMGLLGTLGGGLGTAAANIQDPWKAGAAVGTTGAVLTGAVLAPGAAARLMASPTFINWLAGQVRRPLAANPKQVATQLGLHGGRLIDELRGEELKNDARSYLAGAAEYLKNSGAPQAAIGAFSPSQ